MRQIVKSFCTVSILLLLTLQKLTSSSNANALSYKHIGVSLHTIHPVMFWVFALVGIWIWMCTLKFVNWSTKVKTFKEIMMKKCIYSTIGISFVVIFICFQYHSENTVRKGKHCNIWKHFCLDYQSSRAYGKVLLNC